MKVKATQESKDNNIKIIELGRCAEPNEVFEVSKDRYAILAGNNKYNKVFVKKYINRKKSTDD